MKAEPIFENRFSARCGELETLYLGIYGNDKQAYQHFCAMLQRMWEQRKPVLRSADECPQKLSDNKTLGMMLYVSNFAKTIEGVRQKLDYIQECGVNYLHLMPLLKSPKGKSDGGYAVADFRTVEPELGTMADLETLADEARLRGIRLCLDFVLNHTSDEHIWAQQAAAGDSAAQDRYYFYPDRKIPDLFDALMPQVFPTTAPGNFTYNAASGQWVMTTFHPYQWDLNYANPAVFNDMAENMLFLANRGIDVIRLDAIPYIWKQLHTPCRNLPQAHALLRMLHLCCEIVCPSVQLLGEVVMEPSKLAPYFGAENSPECDILYNATSMCTLWHTLATKDVRLLREQTQRVCSMPARCLFLNYLRCHDDIGWGLDYPWLRQFGMEEVPHKRFLNDWFTGVFPGSPSRGELYNNDPRIGDARLCGTCASLCGVESALENESEMQLENALRCDLMLHAWMLTQNGIPVLYSGDEIAALNDYSYHDKSELAEDSRYLHRGAFAWENAEKRKDETSHIGTLFQGLRRLETIRADEPLFASDAHMYCFDTGSNNVLGIGREGKGERLLALFNFISENRTVYIESGNYCDLCTGIKLSGNEIHLPAFGFCWLKRI